MYSTGRYSFRGAFFASVVALIVCLLIVDPFTSVSASNSATVQDVSLTRGFEPRSELLFAMISENATPKLVVKDLVAGRYLAQLAINIVDYLDEDPVNTPFFIAPDQANYLIVGSQLNLYVINFRRNADGSVAVTGPTLQSSLGDPAVLGEPTAIAVIPRPEDPIDPWIAVGTNSGNIILAKSGVEPCVLPVGGPVVDLAVVPQVGYFAFVALVNRRDGQHLVGLLPPPDDDLPDQIVFDLTVAEPPPDDGLVDLAGPPPDDSLSEPAAVHVIAANGTRSIYRLTIPASPQVESGFSIEILGRVPTPIKQVAAGSLALLPWDGSGVLHDPAFDLSHRELSGTLRTPLGNSLDLSPKVFRLSSNGKFVTAVIEAADGKAADIAASTVKLEINGASLDGTSSLEVGDVDSDGDLDLIVKFNRNQFLKLIPPGASSVLAIARWTFTDGTEGCASAEVRVSR